MKKDLQKQKSSYVAPTITTSEIIEQQIICGSLEGRDNYDYTNNNPFYE